MIFGQILKNVLDKNQSVWIPTIGLLGYDKATAKLGIDPYGSGSDKDLIQLISDIKQVSVPEARSILIQEIEQLKSTATSTGKYPIEGLGDIIFANGGFQFESKKTLFPTNFFESGNFDPAAFKNNNLVKEEKFIQTIEIQHEPQAEKLSNTEISINEEPNEQVGPISEVFKQPKDLFEAAQLESKNDKDSKSILQTVRDFFSSTTNKVEEGIESTIGDINTKVDEVKSDMDKTFESLTEDVTPDIDLSQEAEIKDEDFTTRILNEISKDDEQENDYDDIEDDIMEAEEEVEEREQEIEKEFQVTTPERMKKTLIIDEPRRNIGNSRYDEGYYNYDLEEDDEKSNRWPLVAGLSIAFLAAGFLLAWIIASFQGKELLGLTPLWNNKKDKIEKQSPQIASKKDTTLVDSSKNLTKVVDSNLNEVISKVEATNPIEAAATSTTKTQITTKAASSASATPSKTQSTTIALNTQINTTPKTPTSAEPLSKKTVAVATTKSKKSESESLKSKEAASLSDNNNLNSSTIKDTTSKSGKTAKAEKIKIIGKPAATANYTKGNYYLSFGKFKIASAATKLRNEMKTKAGIETDIILLDGTYRVVVPYLSKEKAESAARDYVSTTLFE